MQIVLEGQKFKFVLAKTNFEQSVAFQTMLHVNRKVIRSSWLFCHKYVDCQKRIVANHSTGYAQTPVSRLSLISSVYFLWY